MGRMWSPSVEWKIHMGNGYGLEMDGNGAQFVKSL